MPNLCLVLFLSLSGLLCPHAASAETFVAPAPQQRVERLEKGPAELDGVGIDEKLGAQVPLQLAFRDSDGSNVTLGQLIQARRPLILTLNYADCPMLCSLQLDGFTAGLRELAWGIGEQYDVLTVSIDPQETPQRAQLFKNKYLSQYARGSVEPANQASAAQQGWHFLTGESVAIETLAAAVGFKYAYVPERKEYAHAAAVILLSPEGVVSRYLYGIQYDPKDLKLGLIEAAQGKVGTSLDRLLLYCFHYDAKAGKYTAAAMNIVRLTGAVTLLILMSVVGLYWWQDTRRTRIVT